MSAGFMRRDREFEGFPVGRINQLTTADNKTSNDALIKSSELVGEMVPVAELAAMRAEIDRLQAALKPFADAAPCPGRYLNTVRLRYYSDTAGEGWSGSLTPEDFFAARKALEQSLTFFLSTAASRSTPPGDGRP